VHTSILKTIGLDSGIFIAVQKNFDDEEIILLREKRQESSEVLGI